MVDDDSKWGLPSYGFTADMYKTGFKGNYAGKNGGAVAISTINGNLRGDFVNNSSGQAGGALYVSTFNGNLINNNFTENKTEIDGGGVYYVSSHDVTVTNTKFDSNSATGDGGGMYFRTSTDGMKYNVTFSIRTDIQKLHAWRMETPNSGSTISTNCPTPSARLPPPPTSQEARWASPTG